MSEVLFRQIKGMADALNNFVYDSMIEDGVIKIKEKTIINIRDYNYLFKDDDGAFWEDWAAIFPEDLFWELNATEIVYFGWIWDDARIKFIKIREVAEKAVFLLDSLDDGVYVDFNELFEESSLEDLVNNFLDERVSSYALFQEINKIWMCLDSLDGEDGDFIFKRR